MTLSPSDVGKVLLVNHAGYFLAANVFVSDNSLASLAAMLRAHDVDVEIVDFQSPRQLGRVMDATDRTHATQVAGHLVAGERLPVELVQAYHRDRRHGERVVLRARAAELLEVIARDRVGLVGFKTWAGEGLWGVIELARAIREAFPEVKLVAGGPAVQYAGAVFTRLTSVFDELVMGDGEEAIVRLATGRAPVHRALRPGAALDRLPMPLYSPDVYPSVGEFFRLRLIDESRGCVNRCAFCSHPHLTGEGVRERTPARVVDEMHRTFEREGIRHFRLSGSNPRWGLVCAIGAEVKRRRLDVRWSIFSSMNNVRAADLPRLAESGLASLFFGIESGDPSILRRAHRKDNRGNDHVVTVCETAMAHGIFVSLSLIVPSPGETVASQERTFRLVERVFARERLGSVLAMPALLAPGSQWWARPEQFGFALEAGLDADAYVLRGLTLTNDFLLPREAWSDYGYSLDGKRMPRMLAECEAFTRRVAALDVPTNIDDTAFMISDLGGLAPQVHKSEMAAALVLGGVSRLTGYVRRLNAGGQRRCGAFHSATGARPERIPTHASAG